MTKTPNTTAPAFTKGDLVRENRQGSPVERVISVNHPMVYTDRNPNSGYHHTKLVRSGSDGGTWGTAFNREGRPVRVYIPGRDE
jgi:hypothetical protein